MCGVLSPPLFTHIKSVDYTQIYTLTQVILRFYIALAKQNGFTMNCNKFRNLSNITGRPYVVCHRFVCVCATYVSKF